MKVTRPNVKVVSITFPPNFLEEMDKWVDLMGVARSELVRNAVHFYIAEFLKKKRYAQEERGII
jgi:metal-responsive CopG/Arc/MetJ family transcriptional regulator